MRVPVASGTFYPGKKEDCIKMIKEIEKRSKKLLSKEKYFAVISPHASYFYSGLGSYLSLSSLDFKKGKTIIIIGNNHYGIGNRIALSNEDWKTPLGVVKVNKKIVERLSTFIPIDERCHKYEHSIEVQLPILQYLYGNFTFVPISLKEISYFEIKGIANKIYDALKDEKVLFIVSSDFTHYGYNYGYFPFGITNAKSKVVSDDLESIKLILSLNGKSFYERALSRTICNFFGITLLIEILNCYKENYGVEGKLLHYYTSADVIESENFVGYASIGFKLEKK